MNQIPGIQYVTVDCETTGLPQEWPGHQAYSIAWRYRTLHLDTLRVTTTPVYGFFLKHSVPEDRVSEYTKNSDEYRAYQDALVAGQSLFLTSEEMMKAFLLDNRSADGYKVVFTGSNPGFDRPFIDELARREHLDLRDFGMAHQPLNIAQIAMEALSELMPVSLQNAYRRLYDKPDYVQSHSAQSDVLAADAILNDFFVQPAVLHERRKRGESI